MSTASREKRLRHSSGTRESMTFNDVAVDFTPEEWGYLGPSEKELYSDVMLENYGHLVHLGLTVSKPDVICHLERGDPPWKPVIKVPRTSFPDCCGDECGRNSLRCDSDGETRLETMESSIKGNISLETFSQKNLKRASVLSSSCREAWKPGASLGRHQSSKVEHSWIDLGENSCKYLECLKSFKGSKDFTKHKKIHTGENAFECHVDGKEFSRAVLSSHVRIHSGEKPQDYCECDKAFSSNTNLIQHVKIHTRDKPYECPEFGKPSYKKAHLNQHMRSYTEEKLYECPECGKTFCSKAYLSEHMNIHNREKPYEGPECAKAFYPKTYLTQHMRIHTGEKPYECPECGKTFYKKNHLTQYVKIHSGERLGMDYNDCEKTFRQRGSLTQHQRIHTRKKA